MSQEFTKLTIREILTANGQSVLDDTLDKVKVSNAVAADLNATVVGSVTANAGTNLNTSALATEATLATINGKITAVNTGAVIISAALPAGNNNIGDVDVASIAAGDNNIGNVDIVTLPSIPAGTNNIGDVDVLSIIPGTGATNLGKAEDSAHASTDVGVMALAVSNEANTARAADGDYIPIATDTEGNVRVIGNRDHNAVDAGEPVKIGMRAVNHGAAPTALAAADRTDWLANRDGIPFVMAGHMNIVTLRYTATAAGTNASILAGVANTKIIVTRVSATVNATSTSTNTQVRVGFAASTTPTTTAVLLSHPGLAPGSGIVEGNGSGILGISAAADAILVTHTSPATGTIDIVVSYYVILEN